MFYNDSPILVQMCSVKFSNVLSLVMRKQNLHEGSQAKI